MQIVATTRACAPGYGPAPRWGDRSVVPGNLCNRPGPGGGTAQGCSPAEQTGGTAREGPVGEGGRAGVDAVLGVAGWERDAQAAGERGQDVGQAGHLVAGRPPWHVSRPADEERLPEAAPPDVVPPAPERVDEG